MSRILTLRLAKKPTKSCGGMSNFFEPLLAVLAGIDVEFLDEVELDELACL